MTNGIADETSKNGSCSRFACVQCFHTVTWNALLTVMLNNKNNVGACGYSAANSIERYHKKMCVPVPWKVASLIATIASVRPTAGASLPRSRQQRNASSQTRSGFSAPWYHMARP